MAKRRSMKRKSMKTMKKRRMSKMRHSKKMIRKSRKMRGGGLSDYFPSWLTGKKPQQQQNYDITSESNSDFTRKEPTVVNEEHIEVNSNTPNIM